SSLYCFVTTRDLHSFPTRRSSDLDPTVSLEWLVEDGQQVLANQLLLRLSGPARAILSGERAALNFLQTLSAVATRCRQYADLVRDRKSTRLNSSHVKISYAVFCLK